ncbi:MAG TPA: GntR family transcriptional regulator [Acidimicrobiales bacterium]|nr:GntR family transcriptional regulator [Acidimicrobiales bacterium]
MTVGATHPPLRDVVRDEIRSMIITGHFAPGARLIEDRLAEDLGVSRNPVREALRVLESERFVEMMPRRGAVVATMSEEEVDEIFEIRRVLEGLAALLAARRATDDDVRALRRTLEAASRAVERGDRNRLTSLNTEFHERVHRVASNGYLRDVMVSLRHRMQWIFSQSMTGTHPAHAVDEHTALVDAISAHDERLAGKLAEAHVVAAHTSFRRATVASS